MDGRSYRKLIGGLIERGEITGDAKVLSDAFELVKAYDESERLSVYDAEGAEIEAGDGRGVVSAHEYSARIRRCVEKLLAGGYRGDYISTLLDTELETLFFDAPYNFDAFCRYIESEREEDKQFYLPRRKQLYPLASALQDLEMGRLKLLGLSLPPGIGKTALAIFFMCFTSGRHPEMQSIIGSHNIEFVRGVYDEFRTCR